MLNKIEDAANLMSLVWANNGGGSVYLSTKGKKWTDKKIEWSDYKSVKEHISNQKEDEDIYWTPLVFNNLESRKSKNVKDMQGCLFVDMDELDVSWRGGIKLAPEPSIVWTTSKTRWQGIWLLDSLVSLEIQQDLNRRLVYHLNADKGAWDSARVLRVPLSVNAKRGGLKGSIKKFDDDCTYTIDDFDALPNLKDTVTVPKNVAGTELPSGEYKINVDELPLEVQYWVSMTTEEYNQHKDVDRSRLIFSLALKLIKNKYSVEETFAILSPTPFNKFRNRPETLIQQIEKAKTGYPY
jgi:hypothetical protein